MFQQQREIIELKMRVERLEEIVRSLGHAPIPPGPVTSVQAVSPSYEDDVRSLVMAGQMLQAIKLYREHTGCSLLEAKMRVEAMRG